MGRLGAGILVLLLLPAAGAIEDPPGDVFSGISSSGGQNVDAPYLDIRNVAATTSGLDLLLRMELEGPVASGPEGVLLRYIFLINLDEGALYESTGTQSIFVLCTLNTTSNAFGCRDSQPDPEVARAVVAAGYDGRNVTSTVRLREADDSFTLGGATGLVQDGETKANDFTDNALPYNSRPDETTTEPAANPDERGNPWPYILAAVALIVLAVVLVRRQRA